MDISEDKRQIRALYHGMWRASIKRDAGELAVLLDDSFVLVHMTGRHQPRSEFLESVVTGELAYFDEVEESCDVHVDGDAATLVARSRVFASPFGMGRSWWRLRQTIDLVRRDGRWLMVRSIVSAY